MGCLKLMSVFSFLTAVYADLSLLQTPGFVQSERIFKSCFLWDVNKNPSLLSLTQSRNSPNRLKTLDFLMEEAHSLRSEFYLQTYDPEGVVFYGDSDEGENWFVLALRNGRPEVQISNEHCNIVVESGDILNDGKWRRITVQSEMSHIQMLVDGKPSLIISILPNVGLEGKLINMRITIGRLLINESSLLIPLKLRLDACLKNWDWVQQNTSWLHEMVAGNPNIQCPTSIVPGTFFQGMGMAVFKTSDFRNTSESQADWSLRFEAVIRPRKQSGMVMAILTRTYKPLLQLDFVVKDRNEEFRLKLGANTVGSMPGPSGLCNGQRVTLTLSGSKGTLHISNNMRALTMSQDALTPLRTAWFNEEGLLFLGGLPALESLGYDWSYFEGCMQNPRVQGMAVDFNQALFVHDAIFTHSCPAPKQ